MWYEVGQPEREWERTMATTNMERLLALLEEKTRDGSLQWVAQAEDRFTLPFRAGTVLLTTQSNVWTLSTSNFPTNVANVTRLAVYNPDGVEVASLQSVEGEPANKRLRSLYANVREVALSADKVVADVIKELTAKQAERRTRRTS